MKEVSSSAFLNMEIKYRNLPFAILILMVFLLIMYFIFGYVVQEFNKTEGVAFYDYLVYDFLKNKWMLVLPMIVVPLFIIYSVFTSVLAYGKDGVCIASGILIHNKFYNIPWNEITTIDGGAAFIGDNQSAVVVAINTSILKTEFKGIFLNPIYGSIRVKDDGNGAIHLNAAFVFFQARVVKSLSMYKRQNKYIVRK